MLLPFLAHGVADYYIFAVLSWHSPAKWCMRAQAKEIMTFPSPLHTVIFYIKPAPFFLHEQIFVRTHHLIFTFTE